MKKLGCFHAQRGRYFARSSQRCLSPAQQLIAQLCDQLRVFFIPFRRTFLHSFKCKRSVPATEIFLPPDVQADKEVTAPHFLNFQLSRTDSPISPGNGNHRPGKTADYRLQWNFNSEIKIRSDQWLTSVNHSSSIGLTRLCC